MPRQITEVLVLLAIILVAAYFSEYRKPGTFLDELDAYWEGE
jgi:hypothetical protein